MSSERPSLHLTWCNFGLSLNEISQARSNYDRGFSVGPVAPSRHSYSRRRRQWAIALDFWPPNVTARRLASLLTHWLMTKCRIKISARPIRSARQCRRRAAELTTEERVAGQVCYLCQNPRRVALALISASTSSGGASPVARPPPLNKTARDRSRPPTWQRYRSGVLASSHSTSRPRR